MKYFFFVYILAISSLCYSQVGKTSVDNLINSEASSSVLIINENDQSTIDNSLLNVGWMYWYAPSIIDIHWKLVLLGNVTDIKIIEESESSLSGKYTYRGTVEIKEIIYREPIEKRQEFKYKYFCSDGFNSISKGDKLLVFFIEYEQDYAIPNFSGGNCNLGYIINNFDDEIVRGVKKVLKMNQDIFKIVDDKELVKIWSKYDPEGLKTITKKVQVLRELNKEAP